jgi:hypothetical protein
MRIKDLLKIMNYDVIIYKLIINIIIRSVRNMNRSSTSPFRGTAGTSTRTGGGIESAEILIRTLEQENNALV